MGEPLRELHMAVPEAIAVAIEAAVARGDYVDVDSAVAATLDAWRVDRLNDLQVREKLKLLWDEGIASGPSGDAGPILERLTAKCTAKAASG